jgi:hypothetical protein
MKSLSKESIERAVVRLRRLRSSLPADVDIAQLVREDRDSPRSGEPGEKGGTRKAQRRSALVGEKNSSTKAGRPEPDRPRNLKIKQGVHRRYITAADGRADTPPPEIARNLHVVDVNRIARRSAAVGEAAVANWNQFAAEHGSFIDEISYSDHMFYDVLTVALHALAARRILNDPSLIKQARTTLERWISKEQPAPRPLVEWRKILADTPQKIAAVAMSLTEEATRLRSSSPLAGSVLTPKERVAVYTAFGKELKSLEVLGEVMRAVERGQEAALPKSKTPKKDRVAVSLQTRRRQARPSKRRAMR